MDSKQMKPMAMGKILTREVDSLFAIGDDLRRTFHVELQSKSDGTMVARFWEYDSHVAMRTAEITKDGRMRIRFPRSAVIYLRHGAKTPDRLIIEVENDLGEVFELRVITVVKIRDYELDEMFKKTLLILFPFYLFRYEKLLADSDAGESKLAPLRDDLDRMIRYLDEERNAGRIDDMMQHTILGAMMSVLHGLAYKHTNVVKGVNKMLEGEILDLEVFKIHDKAWDEGAAVGRQEGEQKGRQEGRAEGILTTLIGLVRDGILGAGDAAKRAGLSLKAFKAKMAEYEAHPTA